MFHFLACFSDRFAYLVFDSEVVAEKNLQSLKSSYLEGRQLVIDYVGNKSQHGFNKKKTTEVGEEKLKISIYKKHIDEHCFIFGYALYFFIFF